MTHTPRLFAPRLLVACALSLVAFAPDAFAQGRKPTVEDHSETSAARPQQGADAQGQTETTRGVRARRVNTSQPSAETNADAPRPAPSTAAAPPQTPKPAAPSEANAKEASTKEASSSGSPSKGISAEATLTREAAAKDEASTKDETLTTTAPAAKESAAVKAGGVEAELEDLRARSLAAQSDVERARLQRALADRLVELNRTQDAVTVLRALMREDRFDPIGLYNVGNALARLDDAQAAAEAYRKAVAQKNGHYSRALNNLGVVLIRLGRWDEAASALASALREENGNYAEASFNLGRLHALRGEPDAASNEWLRALALDPGHAGAAVALARAYADGGDPGRGLKLLDGFAARFTSRNAATPREVEVARGEIIAARNLSPEARAVRLVADERHASASPGARPSDRPASATTREVNATNNAAALLPSAPVVAAPERPAGLTLGQQSYDLLQRARAARGAGRHEDSVALYRRMLAQQGGYFAPANLELGYALTSLQRPEEAIAALTQVAAREGARYPVVFYHLGRLYERTNRLPLAAEAFTRAAQLYGERNPQMLLDVSRVREKEGNTTAALAAMEDYARALERTGTVPDWAATRLAQLRQKAAPATKQ